MEKILFVGRCGFECGVVVGGEIAKNRVTYKYCKQRAKVFLIDLFYPRDNAMEYVFNKIIKKPYLFLKTIICSKLSQWIVVDSFSEPYIKIIWMSGCIHKVKFIAIGGEFPRLVKRLSIPIAVFASMDKVYVESYEMRDTLRKMGLTNAEYLPNCKYLPYYEPDVQWQYKKVLQIFYLGQIRQEKGVQILIDAVNYLNKDCIQFEVHLYGDIFDNIDIASQLKEYIIYDGKIDLLDNADNYDILRQYDIFVFPTEWQGEGLSGAVQDALALGKPVVATNHRLNSQMVFDGENGYLFEKGNVNQLVEILKNLYDNQELLMKLGNRSLEIVEQFRAENVLDELGL